MSDYYFIQQTSNREKIRAFFAVTAIVILLIVLTIMLVRYIDKDSVFFTDYIKKLFADEIENPTPLGLFYVGFTGGLFFLPVPQEIIYFLVLKKISILSAFLFINLGFLIAQFFNYFIGLKLSKPVLHLISKRKIYKTRRYINKYGSYGIFLFNLFALPAPVLTFALGITKYNIYRLFFYTILGTILKYIFITALFLLA